MNRLLLLPLLVAFNACAQHNYLFIKKGGKKKRTFMEGTSLHVRLSDGANIHGRITNLRNDTIFIDEIPVPRTAVVKVILHERKKKPFPADLPTILAISGGVALTTIGLSLNDQAATGTAFIAAAVIGFGPLIIKYLYGRLIYTIHRKKFRIGKRFRLQVFDLSPVNRRSF